MLEKSVLLTFLVWCVVCSAQNCPPLDVVITLEASDSICSPSNISPTPSCNNWVKLTCFVRALVAAFNVAGETRVSVVLFANDARVLWSLDRFSNLTSLIQAIDNIQYTGGWTNTAEGIFKTIDAFKGSDRSGVRNVAIVITDSNPTINVNALPLALNAIRQTNIEVYSIGVTSFIDEITLKSLSSPPQVLNQNYFKSDTLNSIYSVINPILNQICKIVITQRPQSTQRQREPTTTDITPMIPTTTTTTPTTRFIPVTKRVTTTTTQSPLPTTTTTTTTRHAPIPTTVFCNIDKFDVVIAIDSSGSICDSDPNYRYGRNTTCDNWSHILEFVRLFVKEFNVANDRTLFSVVQFHSIAELKWDLTRYQNKEDLLREIEGLKFVGGWTDTTGGLKRMLEVFDGVSNRPNVKKVAVIITDGEPTTNLEDLPTQRDLLKSKAEVFAIGVTNAINEETLRDLSSAPSEINKNYFTKLNFTEIARIHFEIRNQICQQ